MALILYEKYNREAVQKILAPNDIFTKRAGTWGFQGIVPLKMNPGDYVFFCDIW